MSDVLAPAAPLHIGIADVSLRRNFVVAQAALLNFRFAQVGLHRKHQTGGTLQAGCEVIGYV